MKEAPRGDDRIVRWIAENILEPALAPKADAA